jgi:serine/threonine-protein kinase RsbW
MKPVESVLILPSQARFLAPALAFIRATAVSCGFSALALNDIEVAAEEALTNVIKHAFEGNANETFRLSVCFTEEQFFITIHDKGIPFNPDRITGYDPEKLEETQTTDGLGVFLMKKMMDDVLFENLGREGKSLTLIKQIKDSQSLENCGNEALITNRLDVVTLPNTYDIRPFMPEDALEISRCAYKAYGYTYEPYIYYPEQIVAMNQSGTLRSFVATNKETGEILGHIALKYKNSTDRIAEIGVAFVKPECRKTGIFDALMQFCHQKAAEFKLYGILGRAVTSHVGSQKVTDAMGYLVCGLFLGLFPDDVDFKALTGKIKQKETGLLLYHPLFEEDEHTIYLPLGHKNIVLDMFRSFKISVCCDERNSTPVEGQSRIHSEIDSVLNVAEMEVSSIGVDIIPELKTIIHTLCLKHVDAIFLHLDLEDQYSPFVVQQCEQLGFFFSGVLPFGLNNRHELILQYMNNLAIDYDLIQPYAHSAVDMLQYVRSCDPNGDTDRTF